MHAAALREITDAAASCADSATLTRELLPTILRATGADDGSIFHFAPGGAHFYCAPDTTTFETKAGLEWFEQHAAADPHFVANTKRNQRIDRASEQVSARDAERVFSEFWGPLGLRDWLITRFGETPVGHVGHSGIILFRRERRSWSAKDESSFAPINDVLTRTMERIESTRADLALFRALLGELVSGIHVLFDASGDVRWMSTEATYHFALTPFSRLPSEVRVAAIALAAASGAATAKTAAEPHLVDLRRIAVNGETLVLARFLPPRGAGELSRREREVVELLMKGHHPKLVADELGIAHATVRVLIARAMSKLGAKSARDLAAPLTRARALR